MHPIELISALSRQLQRQFPQKPIRGLNRLARFLKKRWPDREIIVPMNAGFRMRMNSGVDAEMMIILRGAYQPALAHLLTSRLKTGSYCLDVGANLGFFSLAFAAKVGNSGKVASFEANPQMARRIREASELNQFQIDVVEKAVHSTSGEEVSFFISPDPGKSSIYSKNLGQVAKEIRVETISIDDYLKKANWNRLDMIKMDIEGNDCFALLGAEQAIRSYKPFIVFEFSSRNADIEKRLADLFAELGYRLQILELTGKQYDFHWKVPAGLHHVDVLAFPSEA